jgi:hypothetical protein
MVLVSAVALGVAASTYFAGTSSSTVPLAASWAKGYTTITALKQDADLAVDGTVSRVVSVTKDSKNLVFTDYSISVRSVAHNPRKIAVSAEIIVHQTGGIVGNTKFELTDDPLFAIGEHVILFLQQYGPDHYFVIGGPTGRFQVQNGVVKAVSLDGVKLAADITEESFLAAISSAQASSVT